MAYTVGNTILEASNLLNDQGVVPYIRWTIPELVEYLNDGLIQIGIYRPDAYTSTISLTLVPGAQQILPSGISLLKSIDSNSINSNCVGAPITESDLDITRAFYKKPCLPSGGPETYRVLNFSYDSRNPKIFYVSPPVPDDVIGFQVDATIVQDAPQYTPGDLNSFILVDQKYHNAIIAWMLKRAYQVDTESETSFRMSQANAAEFYQILGVEYKQESFYKSGYWLGEIGKKDSQPSKH